MEDMKLGPSDLEVLRRYEIDQASRMRGGCRACGHTWRVRNPSGKVNRCPGCGTRNQVEYTRYDDLRQVIQRAIDMDASAAERTGRAAWQQRLRCLLAAGTWRRQDLRWRNGATATDA